MHPANGGISWLKSQRYIEEETDHARGVTVTPRA